MEQFLREGKLDEEDEITETPEVIGEDTISNRKWPQKTLLISELVPPPQTYSFFIFAFLSYSFTILTFMAYILKFSPAVL